MAPLLLAAGFLTEPWLAGLDRPYSGPAIYGSLAGLILHAAGRWRRPARVPAEAETAAGRGDAGKDPGGEPPVEALPEEAVGVRRQTTRDSPGE